LLRALCSTSASPNASRTVLPISRPAVSRHLRLLKGAGLVDGRPDVTRHIYELRGEGVDAIRSYFEAVWDNAAARFRIVAENTPTPTQDD
jgi:DNA-binding transcriptional ArsR family regulator